MLFLSSAWLALSSGLPAQRLSSASKILLKVSGGILTADVVRSTSRSGVAFAPRVTASPWTVCPFAGNIARWGGFDNGDRARAEAKLATSLIAVVVAVRYAPEHLSRSTLESGDLGRQAAPDGCWKRLERCGHIPAGRDAASLLGTPGTSERWAEASTTMTLLGHATRAIVFARIDAYDRRNPSLHGETLS